MPKWMHGHVWPRAGDKVLWNGEMLYLQERLEFGAVREWLFMTAEKGGEKKYKMENSDWGANMSYEFEDSCWKLTGRVGVRGRTFKHKGRKVLENRA